MKMINMNYQNISQQAAPSSAKLLKLPCPHYCHVQILHLIAICFNQISCFADNNLLTADDENQAGDEDHGLDDDEEKKKEKEHNLYDGGEEEEEGRA